MKHYTEIFELFMSQARDNRLEASKQNIRTIILFIILLCTYTHILHPIDLVNSEDRQKYHFTTYK